jgi:D-alanyl-D-alanine carboxypeptidase
LLFYFPFIVFAQSLGQRLTTAVDQLQSDEQFKHAAIAAYVVEAKTGKIGFDKNAEMGIVTRRGNMAYP